MKVHFESIIPPESNSFKVFEYSKKAFDSPWHYHPEYELTFILSSQGVRYVGNNIENFYRNDLVLVGPNLPHCWKNSNNDQMASAIVIQWKDNLLGHALTENTEFKSINKLLELSKKGIKFEKEFALSIKKKYSTIIHVPPFEKIIMLLELLQELSLTDKYEVLCEHGFNHKMNFNDSERINKIYQYVKDYYQQKIRLEDVADLVSMNKEYFSRYFSKTMKKSFFAYLNEFRISNASKLLIETDLQVRQICYDSGYESIPFFYKQFKKYKNCSPQEFRDKFLTHN